MANEPRVLSITVGGGFSGVCAKKEHTLQPDQLGFEFEIADGVPYIYNSTMLDGDYFDVEVTFYNSTKSRSETVKLVPAPLMSDVPT